MFRSTILSIVFILALAFMVSCSGGGGNVVAPDKGERDVVAEEPGNTVCLGLWQFVADKATGEADLVQLRSADKILNVLGFMEPPPLSMMDLDWPNLNIDFAKGTVDVGVIFTHPINDGIFTGFDVRGVVFGPEVTNADGLTIIPSPEFFKGVPFGYQDGLIGIPDSMANYEGLAGYKYYCDGLGADEDLAEFFSDPDNLADRGTFSPNQSIQRNYNLNWNNVDLSFLDFNYALYANYDWPVGNPPWFADDWEMSTANSAEAFCCSVTELANTLYYGEFSAGGAISMKVEVWDWQGDIADVTIKSLEPGLMPEASYDAALGKMGTDYSYGFEFNYVPGTPTAIGDLDILITATDGKTFGECWFLDLLPASNSMYDKNIYNCFIHTTNAVDYLPPTWDPIVELGSGEGTKCRGTDETTISNDHSTFDTSTQFDVTGANAAATLPITYQYYVSTSDSNQVDSPVGWVAFPFDNGGSFTVDWMDYDTLSPDILYIWVRAWDNMNETDPIMCPDAIALSKVLYQTTSFSSWPHYGHEAILIYRGEHIRFYKWYVCNPICSRTCYNGSPITFTGNDTFEWWRILSYSSYSSTGFALSVRYGPDNSLAIHIAGYSNAPPNQIITHNLDGVTGPKYIGYRMINSQYHFSGEWDFRIDDVAIYANP